jgi:hypothetical protein
MRCNACVHPAGSPWVNRDITWTQCWDEEQVITVRIADACPCQYLIQETGEIRHQPWCCGGANHFDISFWWVRATDIDIVFVSSAQLQRSPGRDGQMIYCHVLLLLLLLLLLLTDLSIFAAGRLRQHGHSSVNGDEKELQAR